MKNFRMPPLAAAALTAGLLSTACKPKDTTPPTTSLEANATAEQEAITAENRQRLGTLELERVQVPGYHRFDGQHAQPWGAANEKSSQFNIDGYEAAPSDPVHYKIPTPEVENLELIDQTYSSKNGVVAAAQVDPEILDASGDTMVTLIESKDRENYKMIATLGERVFELPVDDQMVWDLGTTPGKSGRIPTEKSERMVELTIKGWLVRTTVVQHTLLHKDAEKPVYWVTFKIFDEDHNLENNEPLVAVADVLAALNQLNQDESPFENEQ